MIHLMTLSLKKMIKNIKLLGSLTFLKILGAISGLIYSILQVRLFGATALVDSYFIATSAVLLITSLTQSGQLSEVFLPEYLKVKCNMEQIMHSNCFL